MDNQTFIFIHDQDIIIDYENSNKFSDILNLKYIFLGYGDCDKVSHLENVVIARELDPNIEQHKNLVAFTGWYIIWKHKLYVSEYINLFEYDININNHQFKSSLTDVFYRNFIGANIQVVDYIPLNIRNYWFLSDEETSKSLIEKVESLYKINVKDFIESFSPKETIGMTNNRTLRKDFFEEFMEWFYPIINEIKDDKMAGHYTERALSLFYLLRKSNRTMIKGVISHLRLDSHKTQRINQNIYFEKNYQRLIKK